MTGEKEATNEMEDISKHFFELCEDLELGELVTTPTFQLADVMSAIELLEPKMDVGVGTHHLKTLEDAIKQGLYADDFPLQLAVIDATLSMMVAWLEGSSLGSTVWTNVMLANVNKVRHPVFHPFSAGINLLVRNIHALINNVGNLEELPEDFNPQVLFMATKWTSRQEVILLMRDQIAILTQIGKSWKESTFSKRAEDICFAIGARFEFLVLLLEIIGLLVPPEIEDPNFDHKLHLGDFVVHEKDYEISVDDEGDETGTDEQDQEQENGEPTVEHNSAEKTEDSAEKLEKKNGDKKEEKPAKEDAKEECCGGKYCHEFDDDDDDDTKQFKPNFQYAAVLADRLLKVTKAMSETIAFGRRGPDNQDGDFTWLSPFEAKACVRMIPACFPRNVKIPTRREAADWWVSCAQRIYDLCRITPNSVKDLNTLFYFARNFNIGSCVFTRSLLQICMFPVDNHLCGDDIRTVADPIEISLKGCYLPQVLEKDSPVHCDAVAQSLYMTFLNHMTKLAISMYSSFGCNLSRQRDRLEMAIEELGQLQYHAGRLETRTDDVMLESKTIDEREKNISFHSVSTFVFHNLLAVIHHYFELGFRMDLYVPYEFTYIFWFMGDIQAKWMRTTMERSQEIQLNYWKASPLSTTVNQRQLKEKARCEEELKRRLHAHQFTVVNQFAISQICDGVIKLTVVMIRKDKIKVPPGGEEAERLRFERRFEPFQNLGPPVCVTYDMFKRESGIDQMYEEDINTLIDQAYENFNIARIELEKLDNSVEQNRETLFVDAVWSLKSLLISSQLLQVSKSNMIACRLLKLDLSDRKVEWTFTDDCPMHPCLKITK